ncbi:pyridoxamine 5'-phosphate oxidase family protein [Konateibacter massiliensis]|uniref:pyridoxamine 5'-phosphate oxidase family protein n=1 Tax=Konateibacter massiliensis TaxID=2002841 RepID=UPI000C150760|nr:pyridoxamine 5'-phosphate oxidase family protein [Konateibacter massiliensis]
MLTEKLYEVLNHEGVVSIVSWGNDEPHVTNTWNSYLVVTEDERILIPAAGLRSTEADVTVNNKVKVTLGSREVIGFNDYQGTGFLLEGTAKFFDSGKNFEMMNAKFPFANRVLEITVNSAKQLL